MGSVTCESVEMKVEFRYVETGSMSSIRAA
jgi:hypothetical protein